MGEDLNILLHQSDEIRSVERNEQKRIKQIRDAIAMLPEDQKRNLLTKYGNTRNAIHDEGICKSALSVISRETKLSEDYLEFYISKFRDHILVFEQDKVPFFGTTEKYEVFRRVIIDLSSREKICFLQRLIYGRKLNDIAEILYGHGDKYNSKNIGTVLTKIKKKIGSALPELSEAIQGLGKGDLAWLKKWPIANYLLQEIEEESNNISFSESFVQDNIGLIGDSIRELPEATLEAFLYFYFSGRNIEDISVLLDKASRTIINLAQTGKTIIVKKYPELASIQWEKGCLRSYREKECIDVHFRRFKKDRYRWAAERNRLERLIRQNIEDFLQSLQRISPKRRQVVMLRLFGDFPDTDSLATYLGATNGNINRIFSRTQVSKDLNAYLGRKKIEWSYGLLKDLRGSNKNVDVLFKKELEEVNKY